jgi:hypothetical protein
MGYLYWLLTAYAFLIVISASITIVLFVLKVAGNLIAIPWSMVGGLGFGTGGLSLAKWFFKPVRDHLIKQNSTLS